MQCDGRTVLSFPRSDGLSLELYHHGFVPARRTEVLLDPKHGLLLKPRRKQSHAESAGSRHAMAQKDARVHWRIGPA